MWVYGNNNNLSYASYYLDEHNLYSNEFDSIRIPIYLGLDYLWHHNEKSKQYLENFLQLAKVSKSTEAFVGADSNNPKGWNNLLAISNYGVANKVVGNEADFLAVLEASLHPSSEFFGAEGTKNYYYNQTLTLYAYLILHDRFEKI